MCNLNKNFLLFLKNLITKRRYTITTPAILTFCCFSFWLSSFAYHIFKTSVYAIFHAIAESCYMLSINPEYDTNVQNI